MTEVYQEERRIGEGGYIRYRPEDRGHGSECWIWTRTVSGGRGGLRYGIAYVNGKRIVAHRHVYQEMVGPVPAGLVLHHECNVTECVNPGHLRPVTHSENMTESFRSKLARLEEAGRMKCPCCGGRGWVPKEES